MPDDSPAAVTRPCTKCGELRPFPDGFHNATPYTAGKLRYHSWCKICKNADRSARIRTPLGKLRSSLHTNRWRLRHTLRATTRARLAVKIALIEREIARATGVDASGREDLKEAS